MAQQERNSNQCCLEQVEKLQRENFSLIQQHFNNPGWCIECFLENISILSETEPRVEAKIRAYAIV